MRMVRLLIAAVMCGLLVGASAAPAAARDGSAEERVYLALGDSVAFGFNPQLDFRTSANFVGYPEALARRLDLDLTNAACPGEASGGFISLTGVDNGCRAYRFGVPGVHPPFPLHVNYTTSQLDFAVAFLRSHPRTRLVTLDIGANDLFVLQNGQCAGNPTCVAAGLPAVLQALSANLTTILARIRGEAQYHGRLVALTYYTTDYRNQNAVQVISALNATVASATLAADGKVADGFGAFKFIAGFAGGDTCRAGLLIVTNRNPLTCDIHPSPLGREVLATAIQLALPTARGNR
jgi:lysophospholipase L1-like esterase